MKMKKLVTFVLVQILPGLTLPQRCAFAFERNSEAEEKNSLFHWFRSGKLQILWTKKYAS